MSIKKIRRNPDSGAKHQELWIRSFFYLLFRSYDKSIAKISAKEQKFNSRNLIIENLKT